MFDGFLLQPEYQATEWCPHSDDLFILFGRCDMVRANQPHVSTLARSPDHTPAPENPRSFCECGRIKGLTLMNRVLGSAAQEGEHPGDPNGASREPQETPD